MVTYFLSKRIYCDLCGGTMRGLNERGRKKYICSSNSKNNSVCVRNKIEEDILLKHIEKYCQLKGIEFQLNKDFFKNIVMEIRIIDSETFIIKYTDGSEGHMTDNSIRYV